MPALRRRASAAEVFAICISENRPSCMRAPPLAQKQTSGARSASACSAARVNFSPTTEPIEPPMKANSNAQATSGRPLSCPCMATSASFSPVSRCAAARRSLYFFESRNLSASTGSSSANSSSLVSGSNSAASRRRAPIGRWKPHFGHTSRLRSSSGRYSTAPQPSHFSHRPSGTRPLATLPSVRMREDISFCNQLMASMSPCSSGPSAAGGPGGSDGGGLRGMRGRRGIERLPDRRQELPRRLARLRRRARGGETLDQRAADHHRVGERGDGGGRGRVAHAEADRERRRRARADRLHALTHGVDAQPIGAGDAGKRDIVQETLGPFAQQGEPGRRGGRRGEKNLAQAGHAQRGGGGGFLQRTN